MTNTLLEVTDLHAGYGRAEVLSGLNFKVLQGQVITIIGPNGAGKSTTLNALIGLLPARGRIAFDGQDLTEASLEDRVMMGLALVPEKRELFSTMPVEDNLVLGGWRAMKQRVPNWKREIERVYELFPRLKERKDQLAGTMSGGEQQMLAMARALMSQPKVLLLDEPSMGLSPIMVDKIFEVVRDVSKQGVTIVLVEQNARRALQIADRGYVMDSGEIIMTGNGRDMLDDPKVRAAYLGE